MGLIYVPGNRVNVDTVKSVTSVDPSGYFNKENLYNQLPSIPFRFNAKTGNQIKIDLLSPLNITAVAVVNHNFLAPTLLKIKAAAADPPAGGDWDNPDYSADLSLCTGVNNLYKKIDETYQYWVLDIDDATNDFNTEVGEFILYTWSSFSLFHIMKDSESLRINVASTPTHYDQDHDAYLSECLRFMLSPRKETTRGQIDEIRTFLSTIKGAAGRFLFIPDDTYCHCYYVKVEGRDFLADRVYHSPKDILDWSLTLKELTKGLSMLS